MKQSEIEVGGVYVAKVSNVLTHVKVLRIYESFDARDRSRMKYQCVNLNTGREITVRSAARFRSRVP